MIEAMSSTDPNQPHAARPVLGTPPATSPSMRRVILLALVASVAVQLVVLYAPHSPGTAPFPHADKVVHAVVFAAPVALGLLAGLGRAVPVVAGLHAPVSELVQHHLLGGRAGDVADVAADLVGVLLGVLVAAGVRELARRRHPR